MMYANTRAQAVRGYYRNWFRENWVGTTINGKRTWIRVNKRPYPESCELCHNSGKLSWHHWNDSKPQIGLWLCFRCHQFAEGVDKGCSPEAYLELKPWAEEHAEQQTWMETKRQFKSIIVKEMEIA